MASRNHIAGLKELVRLARAFLAGNARWNDVHRHAVEIEWKGEIGFPPESSDALEELHMLFLTADEGDDPQFRADRETVAALLRRVDEFNRG
jgi:hypothetical protein